MRHAYPQSRARAVPISTDLFTSDGTPVLITQFCIVCHQLKPLKQFGLRRVEGKIRSNSQCKKCRARYS